MSPHQQQPKAVATPSSGDLGEASSPSFDRREFFRRALVVAGALFMSDESTQAQPIERINPVADMSTLANRQGVRDGTGKWVSVQDYGLGERGAVRLDKVSDGEAYHVIAHGVQQLKAQNGGRIPDGFAVQMIIRTRQSHTVRPIDPTTLPAKSVEMTERSVTDGLKEKTIGPAVRQIQTSLSERHEVTGPDSLTTRFYGADGQKPASLSFKLVRER